MDKSAADISRKLFFKTGKICYYNFANAIENCETLYKDVFDAENNKVNPYKISSSKDNYGMSR